MKVSESISIHIIMSFCVRLCNPGTKFPTFRHPNQSPGNFHNFRRGARSLCWSSRARCSKSQSKNVPQLGKNFEFWPCWLINKLRELQKPVWEWRILGYLLQIGSNAKCQRSPQKRLLQSTVSHLQSCIFPKWMVFSISHSFAKKTCWKSPQIEAKKRLPCMPFAAKWPMPSNIDSFVPPRP